MNDNKFERAIEYANRRSGKTSNSIVSSVLSLESIIYHSHFICWQTCDIYACTYTENFPSDSRETTVKSKYLCKWWLTQNHITANNLHNHFHNIQKYTKSSSKEQHKAKSLWSLIKTEHLKKFIIREKHICDLLVFRLLPLKYSDICGLQLPMEPHRSTKLLQLTGRWQYDGIVWLALRSVKSNNVDFLNQTRYFSIK